MKKTLITLAALAMASVASAANGVAILDIANPKEINDTGISSKNAYTMILTLDWDTAISDLGNYAAPSQIAMGYDGSNNIWWSHGLQIFGGRDAYKDSLFIEFKANGSVTNPNSGGTLGIVNISYVEFTSAYNVDGTLTLAYTFDGANKLATVSAVKNDGTLSSITSNLPSDWVYSYEFDDISIGTPDGVVERMVVFNEALTGSALSYAIQTSIPEPTTATLSLLALAGLAARRRRK